MGALGLEAGNYGTHSFRIGAASEANARGWKREAIKEIGRWSSDCFKAYVREVSEEEDSS